MDLISYIIIFEGSCVWNLNLHCIYMKVNNSIYTENK